MLNKVFTWQIIPPKRYTIVELYDAVRCGAYGDVQQILDCDVDPDGYCKHGALPLAGSTAHARDHNAETQSGVDAERGHAPLHVAAEMALADISFALLIAGANPDVRNKLNETPLHVSCFKGHADVAHALLEAGANKEVKDAAGNTPLMAAACNGRSDSATALIESGANIHTRNNQGQTAICMASATCGVHVVRLLLNAGADQNGFCSSGRETPLLFALGHGCTDSALELIRAGAGVHARNAENICPLYVASSTGQTVAVRALLCAGADKDAQTGADGDTPLHGAASNGYAEVTRVLLTAGADRDRHNKHGETPLSIASQKRHSQVVRALVEQCATV